MLREPTSAEWFLAAQAAVLIAVLGGYHLARPLLPRVRGAARVGVLAFTTLAAGLVLASVVLLVAGIRASGVDVEAASFEETHYPAGLFAPQIVGIDPDVTEDVAAYAAAALLPIAALCGVAAVTLTHSSRRTGLRIGVAVVGGVVLVIGAVVSFGDTGGLAGGAGWFVVNLALVALAAVAVEELVPAALPAGAGPRSVPLPRPPAPPPPARRSLPVPVLDHLVYAVPDLDAAVDDLAVRLGVRPAAGGRHEGRGTRNALLPLGQGAYLELIGPDPGQPAPLDAVPFGVDRLTRPALVAWAARTPDLDATVAAARARGYEPGPVAPMSRRRPDGVLLEWRLTPLPLGGDVLPFLIDWGGSPHPSLDPPAGATLERFDLGHPDPDRARDRLGALGLDVPVGPAPSPVLRAVLRGPAGTVEL